MHRLFAPVRTVAPAALPVTLAEVKSRMRIEHDEHDALLTTYIEAATERLDGYRGALGVPLITQTWRQDYPAFRRVMRLPLPASAIVSVLWYDDDRDATTIDASDYVLEQTHVSSQVRFVDSFALPSVADDGVGVAITFTAGFGVSADDVPSDFRLAVMVDVEMQYDRPVGEARRALESDYDRLVWQLQRWRV